MNFNTQKVAIFGLGHIGLPTAAILANNKINVLGVDVNEDTVNAINQSKVCFKEPGVEDLLKSAISDGYFKATCDLRGAASECNVMIIIVPTPVDCECNADLSYVISACESIKDGLSKGDLVIVESTVPPETGINVIKPILEESGLICGEDFLLAYSPERALPNNTIYEMTHNVRVVGGYNKESSDAAAELYSNITCGDIIKVKSITSAEMIKLMENTYRDVNIALSNEFAMICENIDVDAQEVISAANYHPRVNIHTPGAGVGGHCIPVDPYFLIQTAQKYGTKASLIQQARNINNMMPQHVVDIVEQFKDNDKDNFTVAILGVAYKGNVDDIRESPSIDLIKLLNEKDNITTVAHDPYVDSSIIESFNIKAVDYDEALSADCVIIMCDHDIYRDITPSMIENKFLISTKPIVDADKFRQNGVNFQAIGNIKKE
ncbi:MAG: nucleotide sugar dehydrogenase [Methanosphaera sp.]|uniref:nucleotide sugar dehydrogenase n=1 Tax=Methanosphaera sp. TaxID=2666342 RepID=UPI0025EDFA6E|nr:nucleotide sugar dehydrogenase [Methanosphaera sp.]MCI5867760.1 nucleotide sugar dehydrogenase [Methanosphaera sp.]MDD6535281.1 nucleotide sugar dehydrogenase [Methanosphaera sp.]MDY3956442.1 nucleotide sugar dehydrogenase [Methanosphaera sp.]